MFIPLYPFYKRYSDAIIGRTAVRKYRKERRIMQERKKKLHSNCFEFMKSFGFVVTMFVRSGGEGMDVSMGLEQELRLFTLMLCILLEKCYIFLV